MARITILNKEEIKALYTIPTLDEEERAYLFTLDKDDLSFIYTLKKNTPRKINYILQLGYYRAVDYFFYFNFQQVKADVDFIIQQCFPEAPFPPKKISTNYHYINKCHIMDKYGIKEADNIFQNKLLKTAKSFAKRHVLPKFVLQELLSYCQQQNVIKPTYSVFQEIVSKALQGELNRLANKLYTDADKELREQLDKLLDNDDLFYNLTLLKKDQKDFSTGEIKSNVAKHKLVAGIYEKSSVLMKKLGISDQNIIHYSNLAEFYTIQKLKRFTNKNQVRLYLLCYAHRRFLKINDNLVSSLIQKMTKYSDLANEHQKSKVDTVEAVDKHLRNQACKIMAININDKISNEQIREKAFKIIPKSDYQQFLSDFKKPNLNRDFYRWEYYETLGMTIKKNIRPIFGVLNFSCSTDKLSKAVEFLRKHIAGNQSFKTYNYEDVPLDFFPETLKTFLTYETLNDENITVKKINGDRYEYMVYLQLKNGIADGTTVHIKDTLCYRRLEDDLVDIEYWTKHKKDILEKLNMPMLSMDIIELLKLFQDNLKNKFSSVNEHINSGENTSLKLKYNKKGEFTKWTLPYTRLNNEINNPFYEKIPLINIGDIIGFAADTTGFMKVFTHLQPKYAKTQPDPKVISACILANATGTDMKKMKEISDIEGQALEATSKNYIRYQTLKEANDMIINQTAKLPIFEKYNLSDYGIHGSVDGQKVITRYHTIKSRYSKKYFGMLKGVVLYSLILNHLPACLKVIGANEHESHYLLDLVESNTSDVEITAISGDMHSINRVNFALMHMFGYRFMPRFTKLEEKSHDLVCFDDISNYAHHIIKPGSKANKELIIQEWDNILRILVSLALKKTTQSNIVRKLSSYTKMNPTLKALIELDKIIRTDYILDYIDCKEVRIAVQHALNRGESYHQLSAAIAKINGGKMLRGKNEIELDINAESIRLIANTVIFYNATLLSNLYQHYMSADPDIAKEIVRLSPVAWQHINFIGKYEFYNKDKSINIQELAKNLIENLKINF